MAAEHCRPEPGHDHRQPYEHRSHNYTQLREAVGGLVDQHTLDRRGHNDQEEKEVDARESPEYQTYLQAAVTEQGVGGEEPGDGQRHRCDQLEEAGTGVVGIRQARSDLDPGTSSEQVTELDDHESQKKEIYQP